MSSRIYTWRPPACIRYTSAAHFGASSAARGRVSARVPRGTRTTAAIGIDCRSLKSLRAANSAIRVISRRREASLDEDVNQSHAARFHFQRAAANGSEDSLHCSVDVLLIRIDLQ